MRRVAALLLVLALLGLPASATPRASGGWGIVERFLAWLSEVFDKEGSQQDPFGPPAQASGEPSARLFEGRP